MVNKYKIANKVVEVTSIYYEVHEYCHNRGKGKCIQKDDMQDIYSLLKDTNMLVLAFPIYYHGISGQLKCVIDRFYSALYPAAPIFVIMTVQTLSGCCPSCAFHAHSVIRISVKTALKLEPSGLQA